MGASGGLIVPLVYDIMLLGPIVGGRVWMMALVVGMIAAAAGALAGMLGRLPHSIARVAAAD